MSMYRVCKLCSLLVSFSLLVGISPALAVTWANEVNISICNWSQLRANVIRDTIYLDGGDLWWQFGLSDGKYGTPFNDNESDGYMYNLSLSQNFDQQTNVTGLLQAMAKNGGTSMPNVNPNYEDGTMLANDYELILYGGLSRLTNANNPQPSEVVLGYEASENSASVQGWEPGFTQKSTNNGVTRYITNGAGVSAPSENLGFYFSGMGGPNGGIIEGGDGSANTTATSLITVNMTNMGTENWQNSSLPSDVAGRANAEVVWLPVSESGVLVAIGGVINPEILTPDRNLTYSEAQASNQTSPTFMEQLPIYDIASQTWYLQNTTGDIPPQLTLFCSVVASASDRSSFNIYIYGGYDGVNAGSTPSDDVYILSIPSFVWIKAYSGQPLHGRSGHKCLKVYPDQMFVLGGIFQNDPTICLDGGYVQVFNLNTLEFQDSYSPSNWSNYSVPSIVTEQIGGGINGGATTTSPSSWNDDNIGSIFAKSYNKPITTYYPYAPATGTLSAPTATSSSSTTGRSTTSNTKRPWERLWVKIVVAVTISLGSACIAIAAWLVVRRLVQRKSSAETNEPDTNQNDDQADTEQPSEGHDSFHRIYSTSTLAPTKEGISRPQSDGLERTITPLTDVTMHTQADSYPIFELESRVDKLVELPCEECEIGRNPTTKGRNLLNLRISPLHASSLTESESIQNTPIEYQRRSPSDSVPVRVSPLTPLHHSSRDTMGSTSISEDEIDGTLSNVDRVPSSFDVSKRSVGPVGGPPEKCTTSVN